MVLQGLMAPKAKTKWNFGPRVSDLNVPSVNPGNTIQYVWGAMKVPGQFIYCQRLVETTWIITTYISSDNIFSSIFGGGKKPTYNVKFTYSSTMALAWCGGPVLQINRIWANGKLMWANPDITAAEIQAEFDACYYSEQSRLISLGVDATLASCSAYIFAMNNYVNPEDVTWGTIQSADAYISSHPPTPLGNFNGSAIGPTIAQLFDPIIWDIFYTPTMVRYGSLTHYLGDENQEPDPTLQSLAGAQAADVPAYRGICYTVINALQLGGFGNTIPTFQAEIQERNGQVRIVDLVNDLMSMSGLTSDQYNPYGTMDNTLAVDGYAVTQAVATRQVLQDMQNVFPFYACEQNYQLTFHELYSKPVAILRREDLAAHQYGDEFPDPEEVKRAPDTDLPRRLNLKYQEKARNYSMNTVWAERFTGPSFTVEDMDITFALERTQAQQQVEEMLAYRYLNRVSVKVQVPMKYIILDPGDVVYIPNKYDPTVRDMWRIMSMSVGANGLIELEMTHFEYIQDVQTTVTLDLPEIVQAPTVNANTKTWPFLFDCPMLNDTDSGQSPGFYVVLSGSTVNWGGGSLYVDTSNAGAVPAFDGMLPPDQQGTNFALLASSNFEVPQGKVVSPLASGCIPGVWD
jgi:hypothetical protein